MKNIYTIRPNIKYTNVDYMCELLFGMINGKSSDEYERGYNDAVVQAIKCLKKLDTLDLQTMYREFRDTATWDAYYFKGGLTADELFLRLGYEKIETKSFIHYYKVDNPTIGIYFYRSEQRIELRLAGSKSSIGIPLLQAINKKSDELCWHGGY